MNINQWKLEVHDIYEKDGKATTKFERIFDIDVINKGYLDEKLLKIYGQFSILEIYNKFKVQNNEQSVEDTLNQRAVKTTLQVFYDEVLFDSFPNADKVLKNFLLKDVEPI